MSRYPVGEPLPASAGLYAGGGEIVQSMFDPDDVEPDYEPDEEPEVPLPPEPLPQVNIAYDPAMYSAEDAVAGWLVARGWQVTLPDEPAVVPLDAWPSEDLAIVLHDRGWTVTPPDPDAGPLVSRNAPETSRQAAASVREGALEYLILDALRFGGWTCDELEDTSGRSHGSMSGAMNRLKRKGLVRESGETRNTRGGHPAAVYIRTETEPIITRSTP